MGSKSKLRAFTGMEPLEPRQMLAASVGWDGPGQGPATLTYYIGDTPANLDRGAVISAIQTALKAWSDVAAVTFLETDRPNLDRSIDFSFVSMDGPGGTLARAYLPNDLNRGSVAGDVQFDISEAWEIGNAMGSAAFDLVYVAVHEIGHSLGLDHDSDASAVMAPTVSPNQQFTGLNPSDVDEILALYAAAVPSNSPPVGRPETPASPESPKSPVAPGESVPNSDSQVPSWRNFPRWRVPNVDSNVAPVPYSGSFTNTSFPRVNVNQPDTPPQFPNSSSKPEFSSTNLPRTALGELFLNRFGWRFEYNGSRSSGGLSPVGLESPSPSNVPSGSETGSDLAVGSSGATRPTSGSVFPRQGLQGSMALLVPAPFRDLATQSAEISRWGSFINMRRRWWG